MALVIAVLTALALSLGALVFIVKLQKDMVASHKDIIDLAMADRMAILDRIKVQQEARQHGAVRETRKPARPFGGEGNIRLRPEQADN